MALPDEVKELAAKVRNWGRWGDDDEIGTLNLITDDVVKAAAREIKTGKRMALGIPMDSDGPQTGAIPGRDNPVHEMIMVDTPFTGDPDNFTTSDDKIAMGVQSATHWDALAHVSYEGKLYNGVPSNTITDEGARRMGIDKIKTIVGRGVLLDLAKAKGVDRVEGGYPLTAEDLDAAADLGKTKGCSVQVTCSGSSRAIERSTACRRPGHHCRRCSGSATTTLPPSPRTTSRSRCTPQNARTRCYRCTCSTWSTWA
jgi:hypothetical protein